MSDRQITPGPQVTAVVVQSGRFEARIGTDKGIVLTEVGPRGGRTVFATLSASEAEKLLALVAHGRAALMSMLEVTSADA